MRLRVRFVTRPPWTWDGGSWRFGPSAIVLGGTRCFAACVTIMPGSLADPRGCCDLHIHQFICTVAQYEDITRRVGGGPRRLLVSLPATAFWGSGYIAYVSCTVVTDSLVICDIAMQLCSSGK